MSDDEHQANYDSDLEDDWENAAKGLELLEVAEIKKKAAVEKKILLVEEVTSYVHSDEKISAAARTLKARLEQESQSGQHTVDLFKACLNSRESVSDIVPGNEEEHVHFGKLLASLILKHHTSRFFGQLISKVTEMLVPSLTQEQLDQLIRTCKTSSHESSKRVRAEKFVEKVVIAHKGDIDIVDRGGAHISLEKESEQQF